MLLRVVKMLKKKLGLEAIERGGSLVKKTSVQAYFKVSSTLIIPEDCEIIGGCAFMYCEKLKKVVIPKSVKKIGYSAFYKCSNATIILRKPKSEYAEFIEVYVFDGVKDVKEEIRS